jgi:hypothetical protein
LLTGVESASIGKRGVCLDSITHGRDSNLECLVGNLPYSEIIEKGWRYRQKPQREQSLMFWQIGGHDAYVQIKRIDSNNGMLGGVNLV